MPDGATLANGSALRARVRSLVESAPFRNGIMALICVNAVTIGLETSGSVMAAAGDLIHAFDRVVLGIFVVEIALRIYAHGPRFFRDPWSLFDFSIVAISLAPATEGFTVLRALRILRALRLISAVPRLRRVVEALLNAVPGIGAIGALLLLVFYVFAVIATKLFGAAFEEWFGTIGRSMFSLFQIMTLESWSMGIVRPVMQEYPWAWGFFVPFIVVSSFTVLNLFIAIIVDSLTSLQRAEHEATVADVARVVHSESGPVAEELQRLRDQLDRLREAIERERR